MTETHPTGRMLSEEDRAPSVATYKADLAAALRTDLPEADDESALLQHDEYARVVLLCVDALRHELIAWCEGVDIKLNV